MPFFPDYFCRLRFFVVTGVKNNRTLCFDLGFYTSLTVLFIRYRENFTGKKFHQSIFPDVANFNQCDNKVVNVQKHRVLMQIPFLMHIAT